MQKSLQIACPAHIYYLSKANLAYVFLFGKLEKNHVTNQS